MGYDWDFSALAGYRSAFLRGVVITLELAIFSSLLGTVGGIPLACLLRAGRLVAWPLSVVVDTFRAIPNLVLIFFFYYFPYQPILGVSAPSGFTAALLGLTVAQAAYSAELIRAALDNVPRSQLLAIRALGFREGQVNRQVVVPSVVRQTLAGHVALWIGNVKLSSLASVIGVEDSVFVAKVAMAQTFRSLEAWTAVALIYVILVLPMIWGLRALENSAWIRRQ